MNKILSTALLGFAAASAVAQVPCSTTNLGTNLGLTDETVSAGQALGFSFAYDGVNYTHIQVCDNGYVTLGATGGAANYNPWDVTLTTDPFPRICPLWVDLEPGVGGSGNVFFNTVPAAGGTPAYAVVTWDGVWQYGGVTPHTFQLFLIDGGRVQCAYDANLSATPGAWLIGASPGNGAALNPVSFATLPILSAGSTFHETSAGSVALAGHTLEWIPSGSNGFIVTENSVCANGTQFGTGCIRLQSSIYEHFGTSPSIDLSNSSISLINAGSNYVVVPSSASFVAPSGTATNLNLDDDDETSVALSSPLNYPGGSTSNLTIGSNGIISVAPTGSGFDFSPSRAEFMGWTTTAWSVWHDFIPTLNGADNVWFEQVGGIAYITWLNVISWNGIAHGTTPSTLQLQFSLASGNIEMVFQSLDLVSTGYPAAAGWIVGHKRAASTVDPSSTDLSTALPIALSTQDALPLAFSASATPLGGTTINLICDNIPAGTPFGAVTFGFAQYNPGLSLSNLGMPGCFQYTDNLVTVLFFPLGASSVATAFNVPVAPGVNLTCQGLVYAPNATPTTQLGALASNGLLLQLH